MNHVRWRSRVHFYVVRRRQIVSGFVHRRNRSPRLANSESYIRLNLNLIIKHVLLLCTLMSKHFQQVLEGRPI